MGNTCVRRLQIQGVENTDHRGRKGWRGMVQSQNGQAWGAVCGGGTSMIPLTVVTP